MKFILTTTAIFISAALLINNGRVQKKTGTRTGKLFDDEKESELEEGAPFPLTTSDTRFMAELADADADADVESIMWLESHNTRRKEWHEEANVTFRPLVWSNALALESKIWADELFANDTISDSCGGLIHGKLLFDSLHCCPL